MVILGAGGHASEILDIISFDGSFKSDDIYFFDNVNSKENKHGLKIIQSVAELEKKFSSDPEYIIGIGNPVHRKTIDSVAITAGGKVTVLISSSARISKFNTTIENAVNIMHNVLISANVHIQYGALINANAIVHHDSIVGKYSEIGPGCVITGNVSIGDYVQLGAGAVILPKVKIADHAIIAAGAVVTKDVDAYTVVAGVPAKIIKEIPPIE